MRRFPVARCCQRFPPNQGTRIWRPKTPGERQLGARLQCCKQPAPRPAEPKRDGDASAPPKPFVLAGTAGGTP